MFRPRKRSFSRDPGGTEIEVYTSHDFSAYDGNELSDGNATLYGKGLDGPMLEASRFVAQATFGGQLDLINEVVEMGPEAWIDMQAAIPMSSMLEEIRDVYQEVIDWHFMHGGDSSDVNFMHPYWNNFNYAWWNLNINNPDRLRHRVAYALSQIMVISLNSDLAQPWLRTRELLGRTGAECAGELSRPASRCLTSSVYGLLPQSFE